MPLDYVLDSLDAVKDEAVKALYKESDGKFQLDLDAYAEHVKKPVVTKNADLVKRLNQVKPVADKFKDVDDDSWTKFQEWKAAQDDDDDDGDTGDKGKDGKVDVKKLTKQIRAELLKELDPKIREKDELIKAKEKAFDDYRFDQELTSAALESSVIGARLKKFKSAAIAEGIFGFHEGKLVVMDDGEPSTQSVAEKLAEMANADDWKFFFEAKEADGGSGQQKQAARKGGERLKRSSMTPKEKSDYIKQNGEEAFFKLPLK